jgi:hypothetical protein
MNWLLIVSSDKSEAAVTASNMLSRHKVPVRTFVLPEGNSQLGLERLLQALKNVTHCIIPEFDSIISYNTTLFLLGYLQGRHIMSFIQGTANCYSNLVSSDSINYFESFDKLVTTIDAEFKNYEIMERRRIAYTSLFKAGIPFTSDCFATHISQDDAKECELFLEAGMDVNARDSNGTPMICIAARADRVERIKWLLDNGADINAVSKDRGYSATMDAVWKNNEDAVKALVTRGANLNFISRDGQSVLVLAVGTGNVKVVDILAKYGADPDIKDQMGMSARQYAVLFKKPAMVESFEKYSSKEQ